MNLYEFLKNKTRRVKTMDENENIKEAYKHLKTLDKFKNAEDI